MSNNEGHILPLKCILLEFNKYAPRILNYLHKGPYFYISPKN